MASEAASLNLPEEEHLSKALHEADEYGLQQLFSTILEYVVSIDQKIGSASNTEQQQQKCIHLIVNTLQTEIQQQQKQPLESADNTNVVVESSKDNNNNCIASNCFVDAIWFSTSFIEQPASNQSLVHVIKTILEDLFENNSNNTAIIETDATASPSSNNELMSKQPQQEYKKYMYTRLLESCDATFLQSINVIPSVGELQKKIRLTNTTINYRQYKFNLFAEESEGYSKLIHYLLVTTPTTNDDTANSNDGRSLGPKHIIGTLISKYSLDPNRCLDVCIDALESEWWIQPNGAATTSSPRMSFLADCIRACSVTQKLPQLLGFKLQGRLVDQQKDGNSTTTTDEEQYRKRDVKSLLRCMAWMCFPVGPYGHEKNGRKSLLSIDEMLYFLPDNENDSYGKLVDSNYEKIINIEKDRILNVGRVRLSSPDGENSATTTTQTAAADDETKNTSLLLQQLQDQLTIQWIHIFLDGTSHRTSDMDDGWGSIRNVPIFQQQWSKLAYLFPKTIGVAICDSVHRMVMKWMNQYSDEAVLFGNNDDELSSSNSSIITVHGPDSTVGSTAVVPEDSNNQIGIHFLNLVIDTIADPLMYTLEAGCIVLRPILYSQICRFLSFLLKKQKHEKPTMITNDEAVVEYDKLIRFLRSYLLPCLSLFLSNSAISMEIWKILELLPYRIRYGLYKSWRGKGLERMAIKSNKPLWLIEGEIQIGKDARYSLKRLSKDTIRDMSRAVAKCCHSHPLVVFTTILNQIESYDNLVQVMVDSCRFVTPLSLDVLGFCILQRLIGTSDGTNRNRMKENGVNVSQWLQSLESFTGAFYKRFPYIEFQGILCYLLQRIKDGHVMELGMLKTLLKSSGGWSFADYSPAASLSASQLDGRAGSTLLKRETMFFGVVEDISVHSSTEVRRVLQRDNIGVSLLILLAQVKNKIVFEAPSTGRPKPVKVIGNLFDTCQVVMSMLLDFLTNSIEEKSSGESDISSPLRRYSHSLPSMAELLNDYKLDVASAWMLCRPLIRAAPVSMNSDMDVEVIEAQSDIKQPQHVTLSNDASKSMYGNLFNESTWSNLTVDLFELFYSSTLYDLYCPEDVYNSEISRLEKDIERLNRQKHAAPPTSVQPGPVSDKNDKDELERMKKAVDGLTADLATQTGHVLAYHRSLGAKADSLFPKNRLHGELAMTFLHRCVYPRCLQGPDDALYCARFVQSLHEKGTQGFSTLHFFDSLITTFSRLLFCLTETEAACVSILLSESWKVLSRWRYDENAFEQELDGKPGSLMMVVVEGKEGTTVRVNRDDYRNLYNKWHAAVGSSCIGCLQSSEYMHRRNCLVVLTRMVEFYPTRPRLANKLLQSLEPLQDESNTFADIKASAQAYSMQLVKARDDGVWKEEDAATVKARMEREQAAAEQRHRKAEEQMAEIKRDQEKITEEIGDARDRDRSRLRGGPMLSNNDRKPYDTGIRSRDDRRDQDDRRRADDKRGQGVLSSNDRWTRGDRPGGSSYASIGSTAPGSRRDEASNRGLEGRWQHAGDREQQVGRGSKRSRPSSPMEASDNREDQLPSSKRVRVAQEVADDTGRPDDGSRNKRVVQRRNRNTVRR